MQTSWSHRSKFLLVPNSPPPPLRLEHPITFSAEYYAGTAAAGAARHTRDTPRSRSISTTQPCGLSDRRSPAPPAQPKAPFDIFRGLCYCYATRLPVYRLIFSCSSGLHCGKSKTPVSDLGDCKCQVTHRLWTVGLC